MVEIITNSVAGALICCGIICRPDLIDWARVCLQTPQENLKLAFDIAERVYNVTPLLDPEGRTLSQLLTSVDFVQYAESLFQHNL